MTPAINPSMDAGIPVLTEVLDPSAPGAVSAPEASAAPGVVSAPQAPAPGAESAPQVPAPGAASAPQAPAPAELAPQVPAPAFTPADWEALEHRLAERVLASLGERIDFVLEQRLRDGLAEAMEPAMRALMAELRRGMRVTLEDVVTRAVAQEAARLRAHPVSE